MTNSKESWKEIKKLIHKITTDIMDNVNGRKNINDLLMYTYRTLYNKVPTDDNEMPILCDGINNGMKLEEMQNMCMTPAIIAQCIKVDQKRAKMMVIMALNQPI